MWEAIKTFFILGWESGKASRKFTWDYWYVFLIAYVVFFLAYFIYIWKRKEE